LATAANWTWNCILAFAVPPLLWSINWKMYMASSPVSCIIHTRRQANFPDLRYLQRTGSDPHVPHSARDQGQDARGNGRRL
jgi:hypothetical protein